MKSLNEKKVRKWKTQGKKCDEENGKGENGYTLFEVNKLNTPGKRQKQPNEWMNEWMDALVDG